MSKVLAKIGQIAGMAAAVIAPFNPVAATVLAAISPCDDSAGPLTAKRK